jgi:glutaredoxin
VRGENQSFLHATRLSTTESEILRVLSIKFLTRQDCHLCDDARNVLAEITDDIGLQVNEIDIDTDEELQKLWGLRVPVVLASHDRVVAEGIIDDKRTLKEQIEKALSV